MYISSVDLCSPSSQVYTAIQHCDCNCIDTMYIQVVGMSYWVELVCSFCALAWLFFPIAVCEEHIDRLTRAKHVSFGSLEDLIAGNSIPSLLCACQLIKITCHAISPESCQTPDHKAMSL